MAMHVLSIGINNYPGADSDLQGCVNDADDWSSLLGVKAEHVSKLIDSQATKRLIVTEIKAIVRRLQKNDLGVITYSGHGSWVPDRDGDESDGRDECFVNYDFRRGQLLDDELNVLLAARHPESRILLITDSCHSGTVYRMMGSPCESIRPRFLPPHRFLRGTELKQRAMLVAGTIRAKKSTPIPGVIHFSGCRDHEYSYDAVFDQRPNGAFTYVALRALQQLRSNATYRQWHAAIRKALPSYSYPQTPQLNAIGVDADRRVLT